MVTAHLCHDPFKLSAFPILQMFRAAAINEVPRNISAWLEEQDAYTLHLLVR